jgi:hypothetical protein
MQTIPSKMREYDSSKTRGHLNFGKIKRGYLIFDSIIFAHFRGYRLHAKKISILNFCHGLDTTNWYPAAHSVKSSVRSSTSLIICIHMRMHAMHMRPHLFRPIHRSISHVYVHVHPAPYKYRPPNSKYIYIRTYTGVP